MKRWIFVLALLAVGVLVFQARAQYQPPSQEELVDRRNKKLAGTWLSSAGFMVDFDKAKEIAKKDDKLIFAYFTRSYAP